MGKESVGRNSKLFERPSGEKGAIPQRDACADQTGNKWILMWFFFLSTPSASPFFKDDAPFYREGREMPKGKYCQTKELMGEGRRRGGGVSLFYKKIKKRTNGR